ncbi:MAG: hypothetical protein KC933_31065 [Myxococcales bacterium]|nr:hypothetical protein [Myxococcales bacterium]MCB9651762.1 hypothetical protein [Deltaproteobacteria bacterium]
MNMETKILLAGVVALWGASVVLVARRSQFKTFIKYVDALVFFPLLAVLIPPSVYLVDRLSPVMFDLFEGLKGVKTAQVMPVLEPYRWTLSNLLALVVVAVIPAVVLFGWRRMLLHREEAILARRAELM